MNVNNKVDYTFEAKDDDNSYQTLYRPVTMTEARYFKIQMLLCESNFGVLSEERKTYFNDFIDFVKYYTGFEDFKHCQDIRKYFYEVYEKLLQATTDEEGKTLIRDAVFEYRETFISSRESNNRFKKWNLK